MRPLPIEPTTVHARAVLLDMDGTLVDSSAVVERVWTDWALAHGLEPADVIGVIHGRQAHESMAILVPDRPVEQNLADSRVMAQRETAEIEDVAAIAGADALLQALAAGTPHALVTSATVPLARARMAAAGLRIPDVCVTAELVSASKPDPEGFLAAAATLGVAPADCVVFEDSGAGIEAAHRAGMRVIGVGDAAAGHGAGWTVPDLTAVQVAVSDSAVTLTLTGSARSGR